MTDIVENEAADEIERLRSDIKALTFQLDHTVANLARNEKSNAELLRQTEDLRATLRKIYLEYPEVERAARAAIEKAKT